MGHGETRVDCQPAATDIQRENLTDGIMLRLFADIGGEFTLLLPTDTAMDRVEAGQMRLLTTDADSIIMVITGA